jgi:hypothetical protein
MIEGGKRPPLSRILPDSCEKVGGFGDGHTVAASGVFPIGREEAFLEALDALARTAPFSSGTDSQTPNGNSQTNQDSSPETIAIRSPKFG